MTRYQNHQRRLVRSIKAALKKHKTVRRAAKALGMPKSTLHDWHKRNGGAK